MHDIKYFFLNKINQTIQGGQEKISGEQITESIIEKQCFSKFREASAPAHAASAPDRHHENQNSDN
jgi:hypothetical protein